MALSGTTEDYAVKLVLFRNAFRQFLSAGDTKAATALFEKTLDSFGGRFASEMGGYSLSALRNLVSRPKSTKELESLLTLVEESVSSFRELAEAETELRNSPSDERAKRKLALSAIKLMDWDLALRTYAELGGERGSICRWELAEPGLRGDNCTFERCGDYWWGCTDGKDEQGLLFRSISIHASFWYRRALAEGKMTGLKVALVKNRIGQSKAWMGEPRSVVSMKAEGRGKEQLIFSEDFEGNSMKFALTTVGSFPCPACSKVGMGVDGSRGFGFGRSSCRRDAHFNYVNTLTATFKQPWFITRVEFDEMERYGNTGSAGNIIVNRVGNERLWKHDFCRLPHNDRRADTTFRHRNIEIGKIATNISFQVVDITCRSEEFIDNVKIYGRLAW